MRISPKFGLLALVALHPWLSGFVLLSAHKAKLDVSVTSPTVNFVWDGNSPSIKEKEKFQDGAYQDLDDEAFFQQLLTEALAIWNDVPDAYIELDVARGNNAKLDGEDQVHSIVVEKSDNISTAAFAKPEVDEDDPTIIKDCDISISDTTTTAKDLAYTIAHELGHCLGLGHPHTNYNAMMGYSRTARNLKLGADDIAGLIYLYPGPGVDEPKEVVCGTVAGTSKGASGQAWLLAILLLLPLGLTFKRD